MSHLFNQSEYDVRCEWGAEGVKHLSPISDVTIIIDILSFSSSVDIAVSRGGIILPYQWRDHTANRYAVKMNAELAGPDHPKGYALSPSTLEHLVDGTRLVLPSPNGSQLTLFSKSKVTIAGCLRNCKAVAEAAMNSGKSIAVIPCGERWQHNQALRPSLEDIIGAGSIIQYLEGNLSPEAEGALAVFQKFSKNLADTIKKCGSGKEKLSRNKERDVILVSEYNRSTTVPFLIENAYQAE